MNDYQKKYTNECEENEKLKATLAKVSEDVHSLEAWKRRVVDEIYDYYINLTAKPDSDYEQNGTRRVKKDEPNAFDFALDEIKEWQHNWCKDTDALEEELKKENAMLKAEKAALRAEKAALRAEMASLTTRFDNLAALSECKREMGTCYAMVSTKEVAAFDFISEMCQRYEYFHDVREDETIVMSDHDIEAENEYSHNLKMSICYHLQDEGIIERKKEDDGYFICKQDAFIKYVVAYMATKAWPKRELLKYSEAYCTGRASKMGKKLLEAGESLPVRTIHGNCEGLGGSSYQIAHVPFKAKSAFPPSFARLNLLPLTLRKRKAKMSMAEWVDFRDDAMRLHNHMRMWKQNYMENVDENMVDTKFVLLRKKVSYEVVSTINDGDHLQSLVNAVELFSKEQERFSKKRPLCDAEEPPKYKPWINTVKC